MQKSLKTIDGLGVVAFGAAMLVACSNHSSDSSSGDSQTSSGQDQLVECYFLGIVKS